MFGREKVMRRDNPVYNLMEEGIARANQRKEDNKAVEERVAALERRVEALENPPVIHHRLIDTGTGLAREFVADGYGGEIEVTSYTPPIEPDPDLVSYGPEQPVKKKRWWRR